MPEIAITTSQNVNINFTTASIGERIAAYFIDLVARLFILYFLYLFFVKFLKMDAYLDQLDNFSSGAIIILLTLPISLYYLILESLMQGQTIGKKLMKIRVVKIDGYQASFGDYFIRWLFRIVDFFANVGLVALISTMVTKKSQRLGDIAAGTAVISLKNEVNISHTILENLKDDYKPVFPQVVLLNDNDMRIIKENYQRAIKIDDRQLIHNLSEKIKEILKLQVSPQEFTERQFISTIIKDYNFYTGKES